MEVSKEVLDPLVCFASDAVVFKFVGKQAMIHFVECFRKIHDEAVSLSACIHVYGNVIYKLY